MIFFITVCLAFCVTRVSAQNSAAHLSSLWQYYRCGDVTVSGNQLTIEALVKMDGTGQYQLNPAGDIVSKHSAPYDANYVLRPNHAEITTSNGFYSTDQANLPNFSKDSFYHVAMTYDGAALKFYVNGCIYSQIAASGSLFNNNFITTIGQLGYDPTVVPNEQLYGYTDEVRIWNVVRTPTQIKANMRDLPNPTSQTGLLAYYKFEGNSVNVQGNSAYNAVPVGGPALEIQDGFDRVTPFNASYAIEQPLCGTSPGKISVFPTGGKAPYTYSINGGAYQSSGVFSNLSGGTYVVSVKPEGIGCPKDTTIVLNICAVTASFTAPDTVCVDEPVNIVNTSVSATSYTWNFCLSDLNTTPTATNLGNPGSFLSQPVFVDMAQENGNYYGFVVNHVPGGITRLDFGNNPLNTPTPVFLGNISGAMNPSFGSEGIQIVKNNGIWYGIVVGGSPSSGSIPKLVIITIGATLNSATPTAVAYNNIGGMLQPIDLHVFQEGGNWYGFTVNAENNTITRFDFTSSFANTPTAVNLGNIGGLNYPTGVFATNDNGFWRVFVTNQNTNSITRLDFGSSLLNTPTGVNLGNPGGVLSFPRDITILKNCTQSVGFVVNGSSNTVSRINFSTLSSVPTGTNLGNLGNLNFPHSLSKLFRVGNDLYSFITNVNNNTITRLKFSGCTSSSIPSSTAQTPPPVSYSTPGTYNISLTVDDALPTQSSICKQVVVLARPVVTPMADVTICPGETAPLNSQISGATTYSWSPSTGLSNTTIANPVASPTVTTQYVVTATRNGHCSVTDTVIVKVLTAQQCGQVSAVAAFTTPDTVCVGAPVNITNTSSGASSYFWSFCSADVNAPPTGTNLGNVGNTLAIPVFMDYANENGSYYGFMVNNFPGGLVRLDFGNSLLNTPVAVNLGDFGGVIPKSCQGIQLVQNNGKWYAIIVGGDPGAGVSSRILKIDFGASLTNIPTATNWGNIGGLSYPHDIFIFKEASNNWYGFTVNYISGTVTRFNFGTDFTLPPTGVNLGNLGNLNEPSGICPINDNGTWRVFVANFGSNTLSRLDFGNTLLNPPTNAINLGNLGGQLHNPRDLYIFNYCSQTVGFLINDATSDLLRLNFSSLSTAPAVTPLGTIGGMSNPHSISRVFRAGADLFAFVPNSSVNTMSRLKFSGCTNSSIPNSTLQDPPAVSYNTPGTYNITLTVDDGLPTQSAFCKQVVVEPIPVVTPMADVTICPGETAPLNSQISGATTYSWSPSTGLSNTTIANPVASPTVTTQYIVTGTRNGHCSVTDTVIVKVLTPQECAQVSAVAAFTTPDTVCVGAPVNITNTSSGASSYYWSFCSADVNASPTGTNLGNVGNTLAIPVFMDYANENGNYYGFVVNNFPGGLVRLDFGNSLLNTPVAVNLGDFGGVIPKSCQGIQLVQNRGKWYAIIVGGDPAAGVSSRILKIDFGGSLTNIPTATNWGNIGGLSYPHDIFIFKEASNNWYGFTVNYSNNSVTRFAFGTDFILPPTGTNLGNLGNLNQPSGICPINDNGTWRVFVANFGSNTLSRLDFGNTLLNPPTNAVNLGNLGGQLHNPRDLYIFNYCNQTVGFLINDATSDVLRLNFSNLSTAPAVTPLGTIGGISNPHSISRVFRAGADLFAFVPNSYVNTMSRLKFSGCTNSSIPNSVLQDPPAVSYNTPGTYNISLTVDDGLPTQSAFCKQVVVEPIPVVTTPLADKTICVGESTTLTSQIFGATTYTWTPSTGLSSTTIANPVATPAVTTQYIVTGIRNGRCSITDTVVVTVNPLPPHQPNQQITLCPNQSIKIGASTHPATYLWNTGVTTDSVVVNTAGTYWVQTTRSGCSTRDSFIVSVTPRPSVDFGFQQNSCLPKTIQFTSNFSGVSGFQWSFGDNQTNTTTQSPVNTYANYGTYTIKLNYQFGACSDSVVKTIMLEDVFDAALLSNLDTTICLGDSVLVRSGATLINSCWQAAGAPVPLAVNTYVKPVSTTVYSLTSQVAGVNLISNGNFSGGNTGFSSAYTFAFPNSTEGQYWVGINPSSWNGGLSNCGDHTSGSGNMMMVNGSPAPNSKIWSQTITVQLNTNYDFSGWISSLSSSNPAQLQFSINNVNLGNSIAAASSTCQWNQFSSTWNSGSNTSATIAIVNNNTIAAGNDFALDDLYFGQVTTKTDSFTVNVTGLCDSVKMSGANKICNASDTITYTLYKSPRCTQSYIFNIDPAFARIVSQTPTTIRVVFLQNGSTTIKASFANSCKVVVDSIPVSIKFSPTSIELGPGINTCSDTSFTLHAGPGFSSYLWQDGSADSTFQVSGPGVYNVVANNICGGRFADTLSFTKFFPRPFAAAPLTATVCAGDSVVFKASGGTYYNWTPAGNFSYPDSSVSKAMVDITEDFTLSITDTVCRRDTVITIPVTASRVANLSLFKSNDVTCSNDSAVLIASGADSYTWTPNLYITHSANGRITVKPPVSMTYYVQGTNGVGCSRQDSVTVYFTKEGDQKLYVPDAFTPNGDGLNDVFKPIFVGPSIKYDFRVYNRWGQLIFRSTTPNAGWDGTFRSVLQPGDAYVYYVTAEGGCNGKFEQKGTFVLIR
jgi:gliding motility-associated-like protein